MDNDRTIASAKRYYRANQLAKAKDLLKRAVAAGFRNAEVTKYLALIALLENDFPSAEAGLDRARKSNPEDMEVLNALAFIQLKYKDTDAAIDLWLEILDHEPKNSLARRNLERMKRISDLDSFSAKALAPQYIGMRKASFIDMLKYAGIALCVILIGWGVWYAVRNADFGNVFVKGKRSLSSVRLPEMDDFVETDSQALYNFESAEAKRLFKDAKRDIRHHAYNEFIIRLNQVLHSNLKESVKQRFIILKDFLPEPSGFVEIKLSIRLTELFNQPTLYEDCYLVLNGKVENFHADANSTTFFMKERDADTGENYSIKVQSLGKMEKIKNGIDVRVLCKFKTVQKMKALIVVEGLKTWMEQKNFLEVDKKNGN